MVSDGWSCMLGVVGLNGKRDALALGGAERGGGGGAPIPTIPFRPRPPEEGLTAWQTEET